MARRGKWDRGKERFWRRVLRQWRRSGLTIRAFCAERGLSEPLFYAWRRTIAQRDQEVVLPSRPDGKHRTTGPDDKLETTRFAGTHQTTRVDARPMFVPLGVVPASATAPTPPVIEVVLDGGHVVRVPAGFDAVTLRQLLTVLGDGAAQGGAALGGTAPGGAAEEAPSC